MASVTYPGPLPAVYIPSLGLTVSKGETVDVPDDAAAQLVAQGWRKPSPTKPKTKAGK